MITIKNEYITASFNKVGAELKSLVYNDTEYIWEGRSEVWAGSCPLLFPICGGLKNDKYVLNGKNIPCLSTDLSDSKPLRLKIRPTIVLCFYINQMMKQRKCSPSIMS